MKPKALREALAGSLVSVSEAPESAARFIQHDARGLRILTSLLYSLKQSRLFDLFAYEAGTHIMEVEFNGHRNKRLDDRPQRTRFWNSATLSMVAVRKESWRWSPLQRGPYLKQY